uniref:Uncharacterized protein n=1 Tax=Eutreptiella gymnastica TaxID=73025 RepID=A0A7S1NS03_9EUGL|mmetsp:Transcript_78633/g.138917  ORF Transcript_78633/g.138917 Transcript_78633/m.138917 type:complete len:142 (+) Transcript_78633:38-463(+)
MEEAKRAPGSVTVCPQGCLDPSDIALNTLGGGGLLAPKTGSRAWMGVPCVVIGPSVWRCCTPTHTHTHTHSGSTPLPCKVPSTSPRPPIVIVGDGASWATLNQDRRPGQYAAYSHSSLHADLTDFFTNYVKLNSFTISGFF